MNIFMYLRAEDGAALREFLRRNPKINTNSPNPETLDSGLISRVCYSLEEALNKILAGEPDDLCKAGLKV